MIRSIDSNSEAFLIALNRAGARMDRAQREVGTGKRVNVPSDAPDAAPAIVESNAALQLLNQTVQNLDRAKAEADAAEQALQTAAKLMDRANTLAAQGATGTQTAESRQAVASELSAVIEEMVGLSRTTVEGRYVFSGDADQTPAYTLDWKSAAPISAYQGAASTRETEHPNGSRMTLSRTAQEIFDAPGAASVFSGLLNLRTALMNNDEPGIQQASSDVAAASSYLNTQLAFYGAAQNRVANALDYGAKYKLQLETQLGALQDADMSEAIVELQQAQTQQQATLLVHSKVPRTSLFDFLG